MCGIVGIVSHDSVSSLLYESLIHLQNRGQDATGMMTDDGRFHVRAKEDMVGQSKKQILQDHFGIKGLHAMTYSILWQIESHDGQADALKQCLSTTAILRNPYAHDCYDYVA